MTNTSNARIEETRNIVRGDIKEALLVLLKNQEDSERDAGRTKTRNRRGFSTGTVVHGTRLAIMVLDGQDWTPEDEDKARTVVAIHKRQLTRFFKTEAAVQAAQEAKEAEKASEQEAAAVAV